MLETPTLLENVAAPNTVMALLLVTVPYVVTFDRVAFDAPNWPATETLLATTLESVLTLDTAKLPTIFTFEVIAILALSPDVVHWLAI